MESRSQTFELTLTRKLWMDGPPVLSFSLLLASAVLLLAFATKHRSKYAPGPRPLPVLGNILDFDVMQPWHAFTKWKHEYGDVVALRALGSNLLVLNSLETITDLLEIRGANYAHRPILTVAGELMDLNKSFTLTDHGPRHRTARRLLHAGLSVAAVKKYARMQEDFTALLANDLLDVPEEFFDLIRLAAGRIILSVGYGLEVKSADNGYITHAEETLKMVGEANMPGAFLADLIPAMKHLPRWLPFHKQAARGKAMIQELMTTPYQHVKADMAAGIARPSLTAELLLANEEHMTQELEDIIKWTVGSMYGAGSETTHAITTVFILAMVLNPEKQLIAQQEIDRVLGYGNLPATSDRERLPYVEAIIKETMRWHPVLPLGLFRRSAENDTYRGFDVPKGTIVVPNCWAIAFEPDTVYPPEQFIPERFLDEEHATLDPANWAFGWGRRICPGKHLGEGNIFLFICTLLAAFKISPSEEPLEVEFSKNLISSPKPFKCRIVPRSREVEEAIRRRASLVTV